MPSGRLPRPGKHSARLTHTFLFTDIEGSTRLWERHPRAMAPNLERHDALVRAAIEESGGNVFKAVGDAFCASFASARDAVRSAIRVQADLSEAEWDPRAPIRVRVAIHSGTAQMRGRDYFGPSLNRCARVLDVAHGGQTLLTQAAMASMGEDLPSDATARDLGMHRLRDLLRSVHVYQLDHPDLAGDFPPLRSLDARNHNLPVLRSSFVGRKEEAKKIRTQMAKAPLLTLVGAGGIGKTRLALQAAAELVGTYDDGVWLVELGALTEPHQIGAAIATALGIAEQPNRTIEELLVDDLEARNSLILADCCEHLIDDVARLTEHLVEHCPRISILATSREALNTDSEVVWRVPPLATPAADRANRGGGEPVAEAMRFPAVRLFVDRAHALDQDFELTTASCEAVAGLCERLDGNPLAIELAAARTPLLTPQEILAHLNDALRLLSGGRRTAAPRHRGLEATIDWSYSLLTPSEQNLFERLAIFQGGWSSEAAETVCSGGALRDADILALMGQLHAKSLIASREYDRRTLYQYPEMIWQFARYKLENGDQLDPLADRHLRYYLDRMAASEKRLALAGLDPGSGFWRAFAENVNAALTWSASSSGQVASGLTLGARMRPFWDLAGQFTEGRALLARLLRCPGAQTRNFARARALRAAGGLAWSQGDYDEAYALETEALAILRELGNEKGVAKALSQLGAVVVERGDYERATAMYEEALAIRRRLGDRRGIADSLNDLGIVRTYQGDLPRAQELYERAASQVRELGHLAQLPKALSNLGAVCAMQGDFDRAGEAFDEALASARKTGNRSAIATALDLLAHANYARGNLASSRELQEEALTIYRELGYQRGIANALTNLGLVLAACGDQRGAQNLQSRAADVYRQLGDRHGIAEVTCALGDLARRRGDMATAGALHTESLETAASIDDPPGIARALEGIGYDALACGRPERATRLCARADTMLSEMGAPRPPVERAAFADAVAEMRAALGTRAFDAAWQAGSELCVDEAIDLALLSVDDIAES